MLRKYNPAEHARLIAEIRENEDRKHQRERNYRRPIKLDRSSYTKGIILTDYVLDGYCTQEEMDKYVTNYLESLPDFSRESFDVGVGVSMRKDKVARTNFEDSNQILEIEEFNNYINQLRGR